MIASLISLFNEKPELSKAPTSLFFKLKGYKVGSLTLDLILNEDHSLPSTVSSHPVETGGTISDNLRAELRSGTLRGLVTNHSIHDDDTKYIPNQSTEDRLEAAKKVVQTNRPLEAWKILKQLWKAEQLVTIVTCLETYENVAITNVSTGRDENSGEALEFTVTFQEIKKATTTEVSVTAQIQPENMDTTTNKKAAVKKNNGQKVRKKQITLASVSIKGG